jgi:hypothetical protein
MTRFLYLISKKLPNILYLIISDDVKFLSPKVQLIYRCLAGFYLMSVRYVQFIIE